MRTPSLSKSSLTLGSFTKKFEGRQGWSTGKNRTSNRSLEYDFLNETYARMLESELLPRSDQLLPEALRWIWRE